MAYTEKYFLSFCNPLGQSCRVSILQDNFVGTVSELLGQADPITIAYDNSDDFKFKAIIESEAKINLVFDDSTLSFSELWTSNERTFKVEYKIESVLEWTGFIIPEGFDYNLKGGKYDAVLTARDGLATLEGILFKTDSNQFYGFQNLGFNNGADFPFVLILTEILRKLDLGIDLWTLVDYYEQSMILLKTDSRNSDPLAISFASVKTYVNDTDRTDVAYFEDVNEAWDCKKIIENVCNIWGSRLYQQGGVWRFKSIHADSSIANSYNSGSDDFVGVNPVFESPFWKYEAYYSINTDINFDDTVFFFTHYPTASIGDHLYDSDIVPIVGGYYLVKGLNKIIEVDNLGVIKSVKNYASEVDNYYWKKYNNTAGYLGRELANSGTTVPCSNKDIFLKDNDAVIRMDFVYKQFRVNFDYTFVRVGDSPINLLQNGNFALPFTQYGQLEAPPNWERDRDLTSQPYPRGRVNTLLAADYQATQGNSFALEMHAQFGNANTPNTDPSPKPNASFVQRNIVVDQKVTALTFSGWAKYRFKRLPNVFPSYEYPLFKAILYPSQPVINGKESEVYILENVVNDDYKLGWRKSFVYIDVTGDLFAKINKSLINFNFQTYPQMGKNWVQSEETDIKWYDFNLKVQPPPKLGTIEFHIYGTGASNGTINNSYPAFNVKVPAADITQKKTVDMKLASVKDMGTIIPRPLFTGLELAYIPDPDVEVPKTDYIYANGNVDYTFQEDPIRIFNGDTTDVEVVSGIKVPTNTTGFRNKWDTFNNAFGKTDIGMILCKSVMQQYYKPNRLLDCEFKADSFKYGDIVEFDHLPNLKFIMLRGSFNPKRGYWEDCTLAQISADNVAPGGIINNDTLDPQWQETGKNRCVKDLAGLNTGAVEVEVQDINTNSDSFGDFRWQASGTNTTTCPIGLPSKYYWGTDDEIYNTANFKDYTINFEDDSIGQVQVSYANTGGKYIYFLHLSSLGSAVQVGNQYQNQIISSFTYIDDITINGYLYRVLRQNFVTSEFEDLLLTYYIQ